MSLVVPRLETPRLTLRAFSPEDKNGLFGLLSNSHVTRYWDSPPWTETEQADRFLQMCVDMAETDTGVRLAIEETSSREFLGFCTLGRWNEVFRSASLGYCLGENSWGRGIATEAKRP